MDEDVFAEDQEVCDVMRGMAGPSPPLGASPALTHYHHNTKTQVYIGKNDFSGTHFHHQVDIDANTAIPPISKPKACLDIGH